MKHETNERMKKEIFKYNNKKNKKKTVAILYIHRILFGVIRSTAKAVYER